MSKTLREEIAEILVKGLRKTYEPGAVVKVEDIADQILQAFSKRVPLQTSKSNPHFGVDYQLGFGDGFNQAIDEIQGEIK